jgi:hypothetical protein
MPQLLGRYRPRAACALKQLTDRPRVQDIASVFCLGGFHFRPRSVVLAGIVFPALRVHFLLKPTRPTTHILHLENSIMWRFISSSDDINSLNNLRTKFKVKWRGCTFYRGVVNLSFINCVRFSRKLVIKFAGTQIHCFLPHWHFKLIKA